LSADHEQIWLRSEEEPPGRQRHAIQHPKMMVATAWISLGFHLLNALPKHSSFTEEYYCNNILAVGVRLHPAREEKQLCPHGDNATVHIAQKCRDLRRENGLRSLTHEPHSNNLASSDFFLFGHVKQCVAGMTFGSGDKLFEAIPSVVMEITIEALHQVSDHWLERLDWVAKNNNDSDP
jgi:hypothetical protein